MKDSEKNISPETQCQIRNARKAPKSRHGCLRCKAKRLKCDERKPECHQCTRKHVACPGYASQPFVWSTKHEKMLVVNPNEPLPSSTKSLVREVEKAIVGQDKQRHAESPAAEDTPEHSEVGTKDPSPQRKSSLVIRNSSSSCNDSLAAIRRRLSESDVPEFLIHVPTMLVEHYFDKVCTIFSSFDGTLNPFRATVGRLWDGSAPIYYAIQSMAAAYLANHFPRMASVGVQMQREAYKCLYQDQQGANGRPESLDKTLLTVLLVGQTTAWHDSRDLGLLHLKTAKRLNRRRREQQAQTGKSDNRALQRQNEFFDQCVMYWDMLAGFVEGIDEFDTRDGGQSYNTPPTTFSAGGSDKVFPHPWTGVAPRVQQLFAQVGRLIRSFRRVNAQDATSLNYLSLDLGFDIAMPQDSVATIEATNRAQSLEEELLSFEPPPSSHLVDAGDENTPVQQYLVLAEAYRCAALLEIYRVFPSILLRRSPLNEGSIASSAEDFESQPYLQFPTTFPVSHSQSPDDFLISLALHVITLLEQLPTKSGTRCLQPIVIITAASELRFAPPSTVDPLSAFTPASASIFNSITSREIDVAHARRFVISRLQDFQQCLPAKPIVKAQQLIQETWARADLGQEVFWMDVMEELGCQTIFG